MLILYSRPLYLSEIVFREVTYLTLKSNGGFEDFPDFVLASRKQAKDEQRVGKDSWEENGMKIITLISRYLLGLIFTLFGFNGIFHFIPAPPPHSLLAVQFLTMMYASHFMAVVLVVQIVGGLLLLAGRFVLLALAILGPVLVNILNFHILMNPAGIGPGVLATVLWFILFWRYRANFRRIFEIYPAEAKKCTNQRYQPVNGAN